MSSIPYKQYTSTNTHFSYTVIYEHTDKILLTLNTQQKQKMGSGLEDLHVSRVCLQRLPSQCCFKTLMTEANRTGFHLNLNLRLWIY